MPKNLFVPVSEERVDLNEEEIFEETTSKDEVGIERVLPSQKSKNTIQDREKLK